MANIQSAKKRIKVIEKKTMRNKMLKSRTKTAMKKVVLFSGTGNKDDAQAALVNAFSEIDKAVAKGIYHKNNAARKKSHLAKMVNSIKKTSL